MNRHDPVKAAALQHQLGLAYNTLSQGDKTAHLRHAITCYQRVLQVYTSEQYPIQWAAVQHDLGNAYRDLPLGNPSTAIACYEAALQVVSRDEYPSQWATIQHDLGRVYHYHLVKSVDAIEYYQAALQIYQPTTSPTEWAAAQYDLANAYRDLPEPDFQAAIRTYQEALQIFTYEHFPAQCSAIQNDLAHVYYYARLYGRAIEAAELALIINSSLASAHHIKGNAFAALRRYQEALKAYEEAISLDPYEASFYEDQGRVLRQRGRFEDAIDAYEQALLLDPENARYASEKQEIVSLLERETKSEEKQVTPSRAMTEENQENKENEPRNAATDAWSKNWVVPILLLMLRQWSSYGYELMEKMGTFGFTMMNPGAFYRTLRQMEKDGMVSSSWDTSETGPARRVYSITATGESYLNYWAESLNQYQRMMDTFFQLYTGQSTQKDKEKSEKRNEPKNPSWSDSAQNQQKHTGE